MSLKAKIRTMFPAVVTAASPLTLVKTGLLYAFGFDVTALRASLDPIYRPVGSDVELTSSGKITYAAEDGTKAPFSIAVDDAGGGADPHMFLGYNISPTGGAVRINSIDKGLAFGVEADYDDGSGHHKMEAYLQYQITDGFTGDSIRRPFMVQIDKVTDLPSSLFLGSGATNGINFGIFDGLGTDQQKTVGKLKAVIYDTQYYVYNQAGSANVAFSVNSLTASAVTGLEVRTSTAGNGVHLTTLSTATNDGLYLDAKGSGPVVIGAGGTGPVYFGNPAGAGYLAGAGGAVTQATSKSTGVTLNKACGNITMNGAALASAASVSFTLTNSSIAATDIIIVNIASGATAGAYRVIVDAIAAGSCQISVANVSGGSLSEAIVIRFALIKAAIT